MSPRIWRSAFVVLLAGMVTLFLYDQIYGYPGEHGPLQLVLAGTAAALVKAQSLVCEDGPPARRTPPGAGGVASDPKGPGFKAGPPMSSGRHSFVEMPAKPHGGWVGAPEHLHWPVAVTSVLDEPVGRHICDECYDECPGAQEIGEGEGKLLLYYRDDDTMWVRDRAGKILQYSPPAN